ncbi:DNA-directed RNA polymerase subunit A'' [Methanocaldococcus indicus]|uniref:DNA-directed RNA polymerase subunit A'' n=1 Tax=Methanocaldococcus indicus TaxID=213231 RepID=UPI003C6D99FC
MDLKERIEQLPIPKKLREELYEKLSKEKDLTDEMIEEIINEVVNRYYNALIEPYEAVGIVAAQSIGEPGTQMSLPYEEKIIIKEGDYIKAVEIGKLVDEMIEKYGFEKIGNSEVCDLPIDIYALSLDQDEKVHWKRIISCIRHKHNGKLIEIKTKSGRRIVATPYHSFVVRKNNIIVPVKGEELRVGDRLPVVRYVPANCVEYVGDIKLNYDVGYNNKFENIEEFILGANKEFVKGFLDKIKKDKIVGNKEYINLIALLFSRFGIYTIKKKIKDKYILLVEDYDNTYVPSIGDSFLNLGKLVGYPEVILNYYTKKQKIKRKVLRRHLKRFEELAKIKGVDIFKLNDYWLLKKAVDSDVVWDKIVEINYIDYNKKYVYDISVEGLETFTTFEGILTHNTMRTFHYAGVAELNVTLGLPRMIEIVDARKEPSTPIMKIFLMEPENKELAERIAKEIESLTLENVSKNIGIDLWKEAIKVELDEKILEDRDLTVDEIVEAIRKKVKVRIDIEGYTLYLRIKTPSIKALRKRIPKIKSIHLKGIPGIKRVLVKKENIDGKEEYVLYTQGSNLKEVLEIEGVDYRRTTTNNIIEIQEVLGIEAARNAIINEMKSTLENQGLEVDIRHLMLVADMMTADGEVKPIGRHGVAGEKGSVLARAAFEETVKHLYSAAEKGEVDKLKGVIENVIVGKPIFLGTGCVELLIDKEYEEGKKE